MTSLSVLLKASDFDSIPIPDCLMSVTVKIVSKPAISKKQVAPKLRRTDGRHHPINKMYRSVAVPAVPRCSPGLMRRDSPMPKVTRYATANNHSSSMWNSDQQSGQQQDVDSFQYASPISLNEWYPDDNTLFDQLNATREQHSICAVPSSPLPAFAPACLHCSRQAVGPVRFVTDPDRRRRWIASLLDTDEVSEEYFHVAHNRLSELQGDVYLCRAHFRAEDFMSCFGGVQLRTEAVPSPNHIAPELLQNDGTTVNPDDMVGPFNFSTFEEALYEPFTAEASY